MTEQAKLELVIGDKTYPFKKVNMTTFKKHLEFMKSGARAAAGAEPDMEASITGLVEMTEIIFECVKRAKPEATLEELEDLIDQDNVGALYGQVMRGSSFVPASGEPLPAKTGA